MEQRATGKGMLDHWDWALQKGVMNGNTARSLRRATELVLQATDPDDWESLDVRKLDVEEANTRFQNLKGRDFKPNSLAVIQGRFKRAVASYLDYLDDPGGWKPSRRAQNRPTAPKVAKETSDGRYIDADGVFREDVPDWLAGRSLSDYPMSKLMDYPFPLREGVIAHLHLPRDLNAKDVRRLHVFIQSLVLDESEGE